MRGTYGTCALQQRVTVLGSHRRRPTPLGAWWGFGLVTWVIISSTACVDRQSPVGPSASSNSAIQAVTVEARAVTTLRDEFSAMARRVPGGFGGVYFDADGVLTILLVDTARQLDARAALRDESFIQARQVDNPDKFRVETARVAVASYPHDELQDWLDRIVPRLPNVPTASGISVSRNLVLIGIATEEQRADVSRVVRDLQIPEGAVSVQVRGPVVPLASLRDKIRPVRAGIAVTHLGGEGEKKNVCTIGPTVTRLGQAGFLTNSHCTLEPFEVDSVYFYQPRGTTSENVIATEILDPPLFVCLVNADGCRNSDAAFAVYESGIHGMLGYIAHPKYQNPTTLDIADIIDPDHPTFHVVGRMDWSIEGETMHKVGRTSGWTSGQVTDGCLDLKTLDGYTILCAMQVDAESGGGDSGSPVFEIVSGTDVKLRGEVFAGAGSCWTLPDPQFGHDIPYCTGFAAANLGGINADFDDLLTYYEPPPPPPPMTVTIEGPDTWPPYQQVTVQALVTYGDPPFTYVWQVNGSPACGNQDWCSAVMGGQYSSTYFYVTVTDSDQDQASDYHIVTAQY